MNATTIETAILKANLYGYFLLNGRVYQILGIYGQCFQCYEYDKETKGTWDSPECLISARMVIGTVELTPFQD
jgi:hypothetical protein